MEAALSAIAIKKEVYTVRKGDYVTSEGGIYTFNTGNKRPLKRDGKKVITSLPIPTREYLALPFEHMERVREGQTIRWIF